jgi:hypothetical protein
MLSYRSKIIGRQRLIDMVQQQQPPTPGDEGALTCKDINMPV